MAAKGLVGFTAALMLLLAVIFYLITSLVLEKKHAQAKQWVQQPFEAVSCGVMNTGIAYRGTCSTWHHVNTEYAQCEEAGPQAQAGLSSLHGLSAGMRSVAPECVERGDREWDTILETAVRRLATETRRLSGDECTDIYLPWALVTLPDGNRRCAFRWGAETPSLELDWENVNKLVNTHTALVNSGNTTCWVLADDVQKCLVALEEPMAPLVEWMDPSVMWIVTKVCAACALLGICCFCGLSASGDHDHEAE